MPRRTLSASPGEIPNDSLFPHEPILISYFGEGKIVMIAGKILRYSSYFSVSAHISVVMPFRKHLHVV